MRILNRSPSDSIARGPRPDAGPPLSSSRPKADPYGDVPNAPTLFEQSPSPGISLPAILLDDVVRDLCDIRPGERGNTTATQPLPLSTPINVIKGLKAVRLPSHVHAVSPHTSAKIICFPLAPLIPPRLTRSLSFRLLWPRKTPRCPW